MRRMPVTCALLCSMLLFAPRAQASTVTITFWLDVVGSDFGADGVHGIMSGEACPFCSWWDVWGTIGFEHPLPDLPANLTPGVYDLGVAILGFQFDAHNPLDMFNVISGLFITRINQFRFTVNDCGVDPLCLLIDEHFPLEPGLFLTPEIAQLLRIRPETVGGMLHWAFDSWGAAVPYLQVDIYAAPVPEPSILLLLTAGVAGLVAARRRRRNRRSS